MRGWRGRHKEVADDLSIYEVWSTKYGVLISHIRDMQCRLRQTFTERV